MKRKENLLNTPIIVAVVLGLVAGFLLGRLRYKPQINTLYKMVKDRDKANLKSNMHVMPDGQMMRSGTSMGMNDMVKALEEKKGDDFDRTFISLMIEHHQGAIDMAKLGEAYGKHVELKNLSKNIITTQTQEITDMKNWWQAWEYKK